jgi:excisionase family DNA binding protein
MTETKRPNHRPPKERSIEAEALEERSFYTIYEVADLLGFHHNTIRRMIKSGELPARKFGKEWRIRKEDLKQFTAPKNTPM